MSGLSSHSSDLMEGLSQHGIVFAGQHLERQLKRPVYVVDANKEIVYPVPPSFTTRPDEQLMNIDFRDDEDQYYDSENDFLVYTLLVEGRRAHVLVGSVPVEDVPSVLDELRDAELPLKSYLAGLGDRQKRLEDLERDLTRILLSKDISRIGDYLHLGLGDQKLDESISYFITLSKNDDEGTEVDYSSASYYARNYFKEVGAPEITAIALGNSLVHIIPAYYVIDKTEELQPNTKFYDYRKHKAIHDKKHNISVSAGIGRPYPLSEISKSYEEANTALTFAHLLGHRNCVQKYTDLGVFGLLLMLENSTLAEFFTREIDDLIQYDRANDSELLKTLTLMLDANFAWNHVAQTLFIHVNTLHYRIEKIEHILGVDLSKMDARVNLYTAIKLHDLFRLTNRPT